ncbi:hypothetical protein RND81_09G139200 [Saponaria officinalis]|uniref:Golgi apparatus membrane protein TVP15 n=1 Tax=Saponaria officinalis TaxID=3572 RepID=A0AAW1ILT9_SAPOF
MANNEQDEEISQTSQQHSSTDDVVSPHPKNDTPLQRKTSPFLIICRCFSIITAISAILCIAVNVLAAVLSFKNGSDIFDGIFRIYAVVIAVVVVVAETEWSAFFKFCKVLEYWAGRGMLQIFVAVMTRAFPDYSGQRKDLVVVQNVASYMLLSCGAVYLVSGILCIGCLKRKLEQRNITRDQAAKDLEEMERKKQELEALLIENTV